MVGMCDEIIYLKTRYKREEKEGARVPIFPSRAHPQWLEDLP
jgi:hypothetical protein